MPQKKAERGQAEASEGNHQGFSPYPAARQGGFGQRPQQQGEAAEADGGQHGPAEKKT